MGRLTSRLIDNDGNLVRTAHCTGTLVGPRHVSTAAHCIYPKYPKSTYRFQPGYDDGVRNGADVPVVHVFRVDWTGNIVGCGEDDHDIAVLVLEKSEYEFTFLNPVVFNPDVDVGKVLFGSFGYPGDMYDGQRPIEQLGLEVASRPGCGGRGPLWVTMTSGAGMSGGPLWRVRGGIRVIGEQYGVLSGSVSGRTRYVGGERFVGLVAEARRQYP